jgi:excisionase family DNA binding protein
MTLKDHDVVVTLAEYPDVGRVEQVAGVLDCSKWTVYHLIDSGQLRAVRLGRAIRVTRSSLATFLASGGDIYERQRSEAG